MSEETRHKEKTLANIKLEAEKSLASWQSAIRLLAPQANDLMYHAKQVWNEDKDFWMDARRKVLRGDWTIAEFDSEMECMQKKHTPVWSNLMKTQSHLREKLDEAYDLVKLANVHLNTALSEDPLSKKYMHPLSHALFGKAWHADQLKLHDYRSYRWPHQFKVIQMEYDVLAGHHSGTLSQVNNMGHHYFAEHAEIIEQVHKKKGVDIAVIPATGTLIET